tara:strand:+ start:349 stop:840 length:492 start_codon:yes stop_codon:yes gene_type:complete
MLIKLKNKDTLEFNDFKFKCCVGKNGVKQNKLEGDKSTPKGTFGIGPVYYRSDRVKKPNTVIKTKIINHNIGWCNDVNSKYYNKEIKIKKSVKHELLHRKDYKYDILLNIKYNYKKTIKGLGSAIFLHLTKNYQPTNGCIGMKKKDFLILLKLINPKSKIKIS